MPTRASKGNQELGTKNQKPFSPRSVDLPTTAKETWKVPQPKQNYGSF
jgi:hypothetical protein